MRILDRYITVELLKVFAICVAGFMMLLLLVEITDKIKYYFKYNPPGWLMMKYFLVKIPGYLFYAIPLGILMGGMLSLLIMARHSEVIAMQANGIDALAVAMPVMRVGLVASLLMFAANESLIPWSNRYSEYIQNVEIAGEKETALYKRDQIWLRSRDSIVHVAKYDRDTQTLERVSILTWDANYDFSVRLFAEKARWWKDHWMLYGVSKAAKSEDGRFQVEVLPAMVAPAIKSPDELAKGEKPTAEMNLVQLDKHIERLEAEGGSAGRLLVDWHDKVAFPFACLIMSALSVPFAVRVRPRGGGVAVGLAVSLAVAFSYWVAHALFLALGHGGYLPAVVAAWTPNVMFALAAAISLLHADT